MSRFPSRRPDACRPQNVHASKQAHSYILALNNVDIIRSIHLFCGYLAASSNQSLRRAALNPSRFSMCHGKTPFLVLGVLSLSRAAHVFTYFRVRFLFPETSEEVFACISKSCSRVKQQARRTIVCTLVLTCFVVVVQFLVRMAWRGEKVIHKEICTNSIKTEGRA